MESCRRQCEIWCDIITQWTKANNYKEFSIKDMLKTPLFQNKSINRSLNEETTRFFLDQLVQRQKAEWVDEQQTKIKMIWRLPAQWGTIMHQWAHKNNSAGVMFTFYELREGEDTQSEPFHMMDKDQMLESIKYLVSKKLARHESSDVFDENGVVFL